MRGKQQGGDGKALLLTSLPGFQGRGGRGAYYKQRYGGGGRRGQAYGGGGRGQADRDNDSQSLGHNDNTSTPAGGSRDWDELIADLRAIDRQPYGNISSLTLSRTFLFSLLHILPRLTTAALLTRNSSVQLAVGHIRTCLSLLRIERRPHPRRSVCSAFSSADSRSMDRHHVSQFLPRIGHPAHCVVRFRYSCCRLNHSDKAPRPKCGHRSKQRLVCS